jgi:hypothetical protein
MSVYQMYLMGAVGAGVLFITVLGFGAWFSRTK